MKTLELEFEGKGEVSGTKFKQLHKSEKAFLYELTDFETGQKRYEVFEKRVSKNCEAIIAGQTVKYEEKELYPKSNCFGVWAWCFNDYEKAIAKFNTLNAV
jgi:hypothetical protein